MNDKDYGLMDRILTLIEVTNDNVINLNARVTELERELYRRNKIADNMTSKELIKKYEETTETSIEDLKGDIVVFEKALVKLDTDFIKGLIHSLELLDPKQTFFYDEIKDLYKLAEILERLDFNRNNYIINVIEKEF